VTEKVQEHLLTPYGLRSLTPSDPHYRGRYTGGPADVTVRITKGTVGRAAGTVPHAYVRVNGGSDLARAKQPSGLRP